MGAPAASGNRGVAALGAALVQRCLHSAPGTEVVFFASNRSGDPIPMRPKGRTIAGSNAHWRLSPRGGWQHQLTVIFAAALIYRISGSRTMQRALAARNPRLAELERICFVGDVRGGDSFSDINGLKRFLIATLPVLSVLAAKDRIVLFLQTCGPFQSFWARLIARLCLFGAPRS